MEPPTPAPQSPAPSMGSGLEQMPMKSSAMNEYKLCAGDKKMGLCPGGGGHLAGSCKVTSTGLGGWQVPPAQKGCG